MRLPILVTTSSFCAADPAPREALLKAGCSVHENPHRRKLTESEVLGLLARHRPAGLIAGLEPLTARVLEAAAGHLTVVSRCGIGLDSVDLPAAERLGIKIFNTPEAPVQAVAELTVGLMLAVLRRVAEADRAVRAGQWKPLMGGLLGTRTVGVVGLGRIGSRVASLVAAFACPVLGFDPREDLPRVSGLKRASLDEVIRRADVLTLHAPLLPETRRLMNRERIASMKRGSVLINASRGGLVDESALAAALEEGRLAGAGLDVFEEEPYAGPLRDIPSAVLTAHMGSAAGESRARMEREAAENLLRGLKIGKEAR
ncbi:MAG: phosphoglycerate dehydrogenase [Elusimicrobia bacterium]|nr:phosphoglycerate dehydrogenase [Elusimicrobiota bacterium]